MRLPDDDELYEVDQTYLGPPRRYIGEMRYRTIFLFLVIAPLTLVLLRKLGMPVTLLSMGLWLIGASYLSMKASDYISSESSAGAWLMTFWHELSTPRVETSAQYAGGVAVAFRHASRPRGGWAKAMRRSARHFTPQTAGVTPAPRMLQATVVSSAPAVQTPPVRAKAAPVRPVIEAKVVEEPLPASVRESQAVRQQQVGGVRPGKGGWSSRPTSSPREPRDVPWKGGAPWQERKQPEQPEQPEQATQPPAAAEPAPATTEPTAPSAPVEQAAPAAPPAAPAEPAPAEPTPAEPAPAEPTPRPAPAPPSAATAPATPPAPPTRPAPTAPPPAAPPASAAQPAPGNGGLDRLDHRSGAVSAASQAPQPGPKVARLPLAQAIRPAVVIAPEPGIDEDDFDDEPSGRTRPRENQDEQTMPEQQRPQSVDDYRKRLDGDDAPTDGGTA